LRQQEQPLVIVTVVESKGSSPREPGAKMLVLPDGTFFGTIGGGNLEAQALEDALDCFEEGKSKSVEYLLCVKTGQCCGGVVQLMMEIVNDNPRLYIFGAGHVGQALASTLVGTPFSIHLIDERPEWIFSDKIPSEVIRHQIPWPEFVDKAHWSGEKSYVAVMTYSHPVDQAIIKEVLQRPAKYIGLIGSRTKWLDFQLKMGKEGIDTKLFSRVQCPIGKKMGGKAPQEVAISIAAELLRIHYGEEANSKSAHRPLRREIAADGR
jgi:xanthine dehydrogenase accessory factor